MDISIPSALKSLSAAGAALTALARWKRRADGDARAMTGELRDNLTCLDMVARDGVDLAEVIDQLSFEQYQRLSHDGYSFNALKRSEIKPRTSLEGTSLATWAGKDTEALVDSIYLRIKDLKIRYPHLSGRGNYRWPVRVNNIRRRIWLLLLHVGSE